MTSRVRLLRIGDGAGTGFVASPAPRLTWHVETDENGWVQASVDLTDGLGEIVTIDDAESALVAWPFVPLAPGERRDVAVRVRSTTGAETPWSDVVRVDAGFLAEGEWVAQPVGLATPRRDAQPTVVRTRFTLDRAVDRVVLFWTALGVAEPEVNGRPVSGDVLSPGWTAYRDRLVHETVDVTSLVDLGENELSATIAGAWYTEKYGFFAFADRLYGTQPSLLAQLRVTYADGEVATLAATDRTWEASGDGPILDSGIYAGEHQDLRRAPSTWSPARVGAAAKPEYEDVPVPEARIAPPVRRITALPVADARQTASGSTILDFGQNLVGRLRLRVSGDAGARVTIRHAEVLDGDGLALRPLRNAAATATFDLSGGDDLLESRFSFYGFRYAEIIGADVDPADVEAVVLHTDMERTGWFAASDPLVERLHENVVWGMRGNFLSIPTDCPQRDERLGWTGDIQVFAPTASFLYDCSAFLRSWLRDLSHEQSRNDGDVPVVVPQALSGFAGLGATAAWGDAATVVPTVLHERFGDVEVLRAQYPSMRAWVDRVLREAGDSGLWAGRMQLGDWLDPSAPPDKPGQAKVSNDIVATAYLARSLRQVADAARLLGLDDDATTYAGLAERSRAAFVAEYVTPAGRMMSDAATAYALALEFDLVSDPGVRRGLADRLADVVREGGYRIGTGFVGTPLVTDALTSAGHAAAAERLLMQTECPSWLYPVTMGATTVWERWDSLLPDGSVNPGEMTSFNHYALGAVADWLHRTVAGLAPATPGYRKLRIAPVPLASLAHASARHVTAYGEAEVSWVREDGALRVRAAVPANTSADVVLPGRAPFEVGSGRHEWAIDAPPDPALRPLAGVGASLADIVDDPRAYRALLETVAAFDPDRAETIRRETVWGTQRTVAAALMFTPPHLAVQVDAAIRSATADG